MKKYLFILIVATLSFFASASFAQEFTEEDVETPSITQQADVVAPREPSRSNYLIGLRATNFDYQESDFMSSKGVLTGLAGSYFYRMNSAIFRLDGEYLQGSTVYRGGLQSSNGGYTPYTSSDKYRVMDLSARWIFATDVSRSTPISVFGGLGYRNTFDGKDGQYDYRRDITYYYLSYGPQWSLIGREKFALDMILEFQTMVAGQAKTYLSDVVPAYGDIDLEFRGGGSYRLGFEGFWILDNHRFTGELSYKKWQVSDSKVAKAAGASFIEPANSTTLTSLTLGYVF